MFYLRYNTVSSADFLNLIRKKHIFLIIRFSFVSGVYKLGEIQQILQLD